MDGVSVIMILVVTGGWRVGNHDVSSGQGGWMVGSRDVSSD